MLIQVTTMLKPFYLQPDSNICFRRWSWCEQGEGGGKVPRRIYRLCQHGQGLGELLVSLVPLFPRSLTLCTQARERYEG